MSQLRDDLIAAKALIDTPKAYFAMGLAKAVDTVAPPRTRRNRLMRDAIIEARKGYVLTNWADHEAVMLRIDRAIEAAS